METLISYQLRETRITVRVRAAGRRLYYLAAYPAAGSPDAASSRHLTLDDPAQIETWLLRIGFLAR